MSQEHHILRCFACNMFQVHIVKKAKKWQCKVCNTKQSLMKVYGRGTGKDCRNHVMKLKELQFAKNNGDDLSDCEENIQYEETVNHSVDEVSFKPTKKESKWSAYVDEEPTEIDDIDEEEELCKVGTAKNVSRKRKGPRENHEQKKNKTDAKAKLPKYSITSYLIRHPKPKKDDDVADIADNISVNIEKAKSPESSFFHKTSPVKNSNPNRKSKWATFIDNDNDDGNGEPSVEEKMSKPFQESKRGCYEVPPQRSNIQQVDEPEMWTQTSGKTEKFNPFEEEMGEEELDAVLRF